MKHVREYHRRCIPSYVVIDTAACPPALGKCPNSRSRDTQMLVEADPFTASKKTNDGRCPLQLARGARARVHQYIRETQTRCLIKIRVVFDAAMNEQRTLELVSVHIVLSNA